MPAKAIEEVLITDIRYAMELSGGGDVWRIHGKALNHPSVPSGHLIMPSTPASYDEATDRFTTISGRVYQIQSFYGSKQKFIEQIKKDIANKGFEVH